VNQVGDTFRCTDWNGLGTVGARSPCPRVIFKPGAVASVLRNGVERAHEGHCPTEIAVSFLHPDSAASNWPLQIGKAIGIKLAASEHAPKQECVGCVNIMNSAGIGPTYNWTRWLKSTHSLFTVDWL
jgi:hypothetical protein